MIYQLVIDGCRWRGSFRSTRLMMDERTMAWLGARGFPAGFLQRIGSYTGRIFASEDQLMRLVKKLLGPRRYAAHQATLARLAENCQRVPELQLGLPDPTNGKDPRLRLCFTELGWERVGRIVAEQARRLGHEVKIRRQRQPEASRIACQDELQIPILPPSTGPEGGTRPAPRRAPLVAADPDVDDGCRRRPSLSC